MVIVRIIECSKRLKIPLVRNFVITKNKYPGCTTLSYTNVAMARAHVGGRIRQRSRLVAAYFALY